MELTEKQNKLLSEWKISKSQLDLICVKEMELRQQVVAEFFPNAKIGTNNVELPMDFKLKLVKKENYTLAKNEAVSAALEKLAETGNEGKFIAERVVGWTPKLMLSEYKELDAQYKAIIDEVLTVKPAAPSLELVAPK